MNRSFVRLSCFVSVVSCLASVACGPSVTPMTGLPIAAIACPTSGEIGVPFTIDASSSSDDEGELLLVDLDVNGEKRTELSAQSFSVDYAGVVVAALKVTDKSQNTATSTCRFRVEGPASEELDELGDVDGGDDVAGDVAGDDVAGDDVAGDDVAGDDVAGDDEADEDVSDDVDVGTDDVVHENLTGSFAMVAYDMAQLEGGGLDPQLQCTPSPSIARVELVEGDGELTMTLTWCHLEVPDVQIGLFGVQDSEIPDETTALFGALGPATFPFDGATFAPPLDVFGRALLAGATNTDGPLPTNDFAPNVSNPDGDNNQGVPMFAGSVLPIQLNVAMRRTITSLAGSVVSTSEIAGDADGSFQVTHEIGLLDSGATSLAQPESSTALPSRFHMTRVADGATCGSLVAQQATLMTAVSAPEMPDGCFVPEQR